MEEIGVMAGKGWPGRRASGEDGGAPAIPATSAVRGTTRGRSGRPVVRTGSQMLARSRKTQAAPEAPPKAGA